MEEDVYIVVVPGAVCKATAIEHGIVEHEECAELPDINGVEEDCVDNGNEEQCEEHPQHRVGETWMA